MTQLIGQAPAELLFILSLKEVSNMAVTCLVPFISHPSDPSYVDSFVEPFVEAYIVDKHLLRDTTFGQTMVAQITLVDTVLIETALKDIFLRAAWLLKDTILRAA